jgi:hypothetical protein
MWHEVFTPPYFIRLSIHLTYCVCLSTSCAYKTDIRQVDTEIVDQKQEDWGGRCRDVVEAKVEDDN